MSQSTEDDFFFRALLLRLQDALSDTDRFQLNFLFGEDIPRRLQFDGSLETALEVLQTLFDRTKISKDNCDYLIERLKAIERHDCVEKLQNYQRLVTKNILPPANDQRQNLLETTAQPEPQTPTMEEILQDFDEEDGGVHLGNSVKSSAELNYKCPDPVAMDFDEIDLRPFEDENCPWTENYSKLLNLQYHPRQYQIEIIRDAVRHEHTIVCLRTGSGKTFIASVLIKYYFIKKNQKDRQSSFTTFFFVPRKAIRLQQTKAIVSVNNLKVAICGDDETIDKLMDKNHVIVTTPQKLVNCLEKKVVFLSNIDLMIFDECHNTSGSNPYCEIMKFYLCPSKDNSSKKPRIIGLTASISAKDANEKRDSVEKNLVSLCSKLACENISTVCHAENREEINREISRPSNDQFQYVDRMENDSFFFQYSKSFETLVKNIQTNLDENVVLKDHSIGSSGYIAQLVLLKATFERKGQMNNVIISDYLLLLTKKYLALRDLPFDQVIRYILKKIDRYHRDHRRPIAFDDILYEYSQTTLNSILEEHEKHPTNNSKLNTLIGVIKNHTTDRTKGLLLVQTTFYAKTLYDYLTHHPDLQNIVKPTWIVGQSSRDFNQTIVEQETQLKRFSENQCNLLVATDIVQEGLDIPTCSYVIRYEFVSDEIGTVQSRGRARAANSFYYLITETDSINHQREKANKEREDEMEEAIEKWPHIDKDLFRADVKSKTENLIKSWEQEIDRQRREKEILRRIGKKEGSIHCRKCSDPLGELSWLKKRNTIYFINDRKFFEINQCQVRPVYERFQENLTMGDVKCRCGNSLGGYQKFIDRPELGSLCALKCKQIKFLIEGQLPYAEFSQWSKNNRFDVDELEEI